MQNMMRTHIYVEGAIQGIRLLTNRTAENIREQPIGNCIGKGIL